MKASAKDSTQATSQAILADVDPSDRDVSSCVDTSPPAVDCRAPKRLWRRTCWRTSLGRGGQRWKP